MSEAACQVAESVGPVVREALLVQERSPFARQQGQQAHHAQSYFEPPRALKLKVIVRILSPTPLYKIWWNYGGI